MPIESISQHTSELRKPIKNLTIKGNLIMEGIIMRKFPDYKIAMEKRIGQSIDYHHINEDLFKEIHPGRYDDNGNLTDYGRSWLGSSMSSILKGAKEDKNGLISVKEFIKIYLSKFK